MFQWISEVLQILNLERYNRFNFIGLCCNRYISPSKLRSCYQNILAVSVMLLYLLRIAKFLLQKTTMCKCRCFWYETVNKLLFYSTTQKIIKMSDVRATLSEVTRQCNLICCKQFNSHNSEGKWKDDLEDFMIWLP